MYESIRDTNVDDTRYLWTLCEPSYFHAINRAAWRLWNYKKAHVCSKKVHSLGDYVS